MSSNEKNNNPNYSNSTVKNVVPPSELKHDTQHPELDEIDFQHQVYANYRGSPDDYHSFFTDIDYKNGLFLLATNTFTHTFFDGCIIAAKNFDVVATANILDISFSKKFEDTPTATKFVGTNNFIVGFISGKLLLFKTSNAHVVGNYNENNGSVTAIDENKQSKKVFVASSRGQLSVFATEEKLSREREIANAHYDKITGVSTHPSSSKQCATSSADKNVVLWDTNQKYLGSRLLREYCNQLTSIHWSTQEENNELVMVGDEIGNVLTLDPRQPNKILNETSIAKREITQLAFNQSKHFGAIPKFKTMEIVEIDPSGELKKIHTHTAPGMLYSMCWDDKDIKTFYVVGEDKYAEKVVMA